MSRTRKVVGERAFSLVELLVVIAIVGIGAAVLLIATNSARFRGRMIDAQSDAHTIMRSMVLDAGSAARWIVREINGSIGESVYIDGVPWPAKGLTQPGSHVFQTSTDFFKYCITNKLLDAKPGFFAAGGLKPAESIEDFQGANNAWSLVADVSESYFDTAPVLISQNLEISTIGETLTADSEGWWNDLQDSTCDKPRPFGEKGFVFAVKMGSAFPMYPERLKYYIITNMFLQRAPNSPTNMANEILNPYSP